MTAEADCGCGEKICADCGYCRGSLAHCSALKPPAPVSSGEAGMDEALVEVDPPLVEALRPMVARYGALGVKHVVDLLTDRALDTTDA